jgi:hypothetical protein
MVWRRRAILQEIQERAHCGSSATLVGDSNGKAMSAGFVNVYDDRARAAAYARLEFPGTYYLAFRDLPAILAEHVQGRQAVDFGCGTGVRPWRSRRKPPLGE